MDESVASSPTNRALPWESPTLFPPKPEGASEYGYVARGQAHPATREQLIERARNVEAALPLVWVPEFDRLVPPEQVPFLHEPLVQRERLEARDGIRGNLIQGAIFLGLFAFYAIYSPGADAFILLVLAIVFGAVPAIQNVNRLRHLKRYTPDDFDDDVRAIRYGAWLGRRRLVSTWVIGVSILLVAIAQVGAPDLIPDTRVLESGLSAGLLKELPANGGVRQIYAEMIEAPDPADPTSNATWARIDPSEQKWRLLTCAFLHGHPLHLLLNFVALLQLGRLVEMHAHRVYLPIVFLFSVIAGSVASLYLGPSALSVGASGGLMGLIGFLAVMGYRRREYLPPGFLRAMIISILLIVALGIFAHRMIDNAAHVGGLVGGIMLGVVYITRRSDEVYLQPSFLARVAGLICTLALVGIAVFAIIRILYFPVVMVPVAG